MKKEKRIIRIETLEDLPISIDTKDIEWEIVPGSKYGERMAESNLHCKVNHPKVMAPDLPPLPEGAVPLPVGFKRPEGAFDSWGCYIHGKNWHYTPLRVGEYGNDPQYRYAVRPDTEIARINGVGFGPCPSRWGWHNPEGLTPEQVGVPEYRLLCRDEVRSRPATSIRIEAYSSMQYKWVAGMFGHDKRVTYRTAAPYGSLAPVTEHTFPECAPTKPDLGYGFNLDGYAITAPDHNHEIIPEGTRVHPGEVTHMFINYVGWTKWTFANPPDRIGVQHSVRAYARLKYSVLHERSGIKPGDVVEVVRAAEDYERGWGFSWIPEMNRLIGNRYKVERDHEVGFTLWEGGNKKSGFVPAFVLRKVESERRKVPLEPTDWKLGDKVRPTEWPCYQYMVTAIDNATGKIKVSQDRKGWISQREQQRHWERHNRTTGEWTECWKWADESEG